MRIIVAVLMLFSALLSAHCALAVSAQLGPGKVVADGVRTWATRLTRADGGTTEVWIYLPDPAPKGKLPCVLIAPAGSPLVIGMDLAEDDRPMHIPFARSGMAVVAYSISGGLDDPTTASNAAYHQACTAYKNAHAGLSDEKAALDYARQNVPEIDPDRIFTAGHSSAGTLSLLVAEYEPRIKACVAFAPAPNILAFQDADAITLIDNRIEGFREFLRRASPINSTDKLKCPVSIFHADDDDVVSQFAVESFIAKLKRTNTAVTYVHPATGGHNDALEDGIAQSIAWLKKQ